MTDSMPNPGGAELWGASLACSEAKSRLLSWANEADEHARQARGSLSSIAVRSGLAVVGGMLLGRMVMGAAPCDRAKKPRAGKRLFRAAVLLRAGMWLLPHVVRACQSKRKEQTAA